MSTTYETTEGTQPHANVAHEPRTMKRIQEPDERIHDEHDLFMMTEIGDGVFVQWGSCSKCNVRAYDCKCKSGPVEPEYIGRWRTARFDKELNARPEPDHKVLPGVIDWLRDRGYTVKKPKSSVFDRPENNVYMVDEPLEGPPPADEPEEPVNQDPEDEAKMVDDGLDEALSRVREARSLDSAVELDPGF